jgi:hypothetical protein
MNSDLPFPPTRTWDARARRRVGDFWSRFLRWAEQNPEALARLKLWGVELAEMPPQQGLLGLLRTFFLGVAPPNWQGLAAGMNFQADELMSETGLCLVWVPEAQVIAELLAAADKEDRDAVLVRNSDRILTSIERVLAEVMHPQLGLLRESTIEAVHTARAGHFGASQALSATILTSVLEEHYGLKFGPARKTFDAEPPAAAGIWSHRRALVQRAIGLSILNSHRRSADGGFNRHITGHGSDLRHLCEPHSLEALMLTGGAVRELQVIYRVAECGFAPTPHLERQAAAYLPPPTSGLAPAG